METVGERLMDFKENVRSIGEYKPQLVVSHHANFLIEHIDEFDLLSLGVKDFINFNADLYQKQQGGKRKLAIEFASEVLFYIIVKLSGVKTKTTH